MIHVKCGKTSKLLYLFKNINKSLCIIVYLINELLHIKLTVTSYYRKWWKSLSTCKHLNALKYQEDRYIKYRKYKSLWLTPLLLLLFRSFTHNNKSRLTVDIPRHLGLMHTFKGSSTAHTQEKQLKCTVKKKRDTSLIH